MPFPHYSRHAAFYSGWRESPTRYNAGVSRCAGEWHVWMIMRQVLVASSYVHHVLVVHVESVELVNIDMKVLFGIPAWSILQSWFSMVIWRLCDTTAIVLADETQGSIFSWTRWNVPLSNFPNAFDLCKGQPAVRWSRIVLFSLQPRDDNFLPKSRRAVTKLSKWKW